MLLRLTEEDSLIPPRYSLVTKTTEEKNPGSGSLLAVGTSKLSRATVLSFYEWFCIPVRRPPV